MGLEITVLYAANSEGRERGDPVMGWKNHEFVGRKGLPNEGNMTKLLDHILI